MIPAARSKIEMWYGCTMAWGDLRFDHSDIFSGPTGKARRDDRPVLPKKRGGRRPLLKGKILAALSTAARPMTRLEIADAVGHRRPAATVGHFLRAMVAEGLVLVEEGPSTGNRGTRPNVYRPKA